LDFKEDEMEYNGNEKKIIEKAKFYCQEKIKAHVFTIPKGTFKNGLFCSDLMNEKFFWFLENDGDVPIRLFLSEIIDIDDYHERDLYKEAFPEDKNKGYKSVYKRGGSGR